MKYPKLEVGDVVQIKDSGSGFLEEDVGKFVEVIKCSLETQGLRCYYTVKKYDKKLATPSDFATGEYGGVSVYTFGENPTVLCNILEEGSTEMSESLGKVMGVIPSKTEYSNSHYDNYYHLTDADIAEGKVRVDAYWVAKQWRTGSRDDSGALWHSLKTIARFGEKNSKEREIKALYNQALALARIYNVDLKDE